MVAFGVSAVAVSAVFALVTWSLASQPGVRAVDRERVFERFARGSAARRELDDAGSGLGLALAAQHVSLHGGELWVQDRPGGGARFVVQLAQAHAGQHVDAAEGSQ